MYIPNQQTLVEDTVSPAEAAAPWSGCEIAPGLYPLGIRSAVEANQQDTSINVPSAFIGVSIAALIFVLLIVAYTIYKKCTSTDSDSFSDTVSSASESAWRVEDPESASEATDAKHRRRLKKLDQVAPVQTLHDWRTEKQLTHVQTFATVSTKLI